MSHNLSLKYTIHRDTLTPHNAQKVWGVFMEERQYG